MINWTGPESHGVREAKVIPDPANHFQQDIPSSLPLTQKASSTQVYRKVTVIK